jgi:hypothetical protein
MFRLPGAFVIGSNLSFDTNTDGLISPLSVQGQFTKKFYDSVAHLDTDLNRVLGNVTPQATSTTKPGKPQIYPVGTTVHVVAKGRTAYFVAISSINDHGVAHGSFEDLKTSLPLMWDYIATRGSFEPLVIPVLGSGFSRLPQPREEIVRTIVDSFIAACSSYRFTEALVIVIPYKDFYEHDVSFPKLERYVQHVCQYTGFKGATARGAGEAIK